MMLKTGAGLGAIMAAGAWFSGAFDMGYARTVQRPPAEVIAALEDLDITAQPGAPGTDPSRSGGVKPLFRLAKSANAMTWYVMSGDQVATTMTVLLEPVNGGAETRVTTKVVRGDAPDDRVSPAFRSVGITTGLFSMAVEGELNKLTAPAPTRTAEECQEIFVTHMAGASNEGANLTQAMANTAKVAIRMHAVRDRMRQAGCDVDSPPGEFRAVSQQMKPADPLPAALETERDDIRFQPGKPMVDVGRR